MNIFFWLAITLKFNRFPKAAQQTKSRKSHSLEPKNHPQLFQKYFLKAKTNFSEVVNDRIMQIISIAIIFLKLRLT